MRQFWVGCGLVTGSSIFSRVLLRSLSLGRTKITDAGLKALAGLKELRTLDIGFTPITDAGLKELAGLKGLQILDLRKTKVSDAGVADMQNAMPELRINR